MKKQTKKKKQKRIKGNINAFGVNPYGKGKIEFTVPNWVEESRNPMGGLGETGKW